MTHENALDGVSEVLLGEGHHGGGEEGGGGDPVVQPEDPAVDADFVEVGESTDLVRKRRRSPISSLGKEQRTERTKQELVKCECMFSEMLMGKREASP